LIAKQLGGDGLAERWLTLVVGVSRAAAPQRLFGGFDNVRRRGRIGLPAHERNGRFPARLIFTNLLQDAIHRGGA
jgi:hypothetical protein